MKKLTVFLVLALLLVSVTAASAATPSYTEGWDGKRGTDSWNCYVADKNDPRYEFQETGWIHWVFSTKGKSTSASLTLYGTGTGTYAPGNPLKANVWHFYTPYYDLDGLTAIISLYGGKPGPGGGLVISDWCPGEYESLDVSKTAVTSFEREHFWKIAKKVVTEKNLKLDGYPKIWLYADGTGDEKATWAVNVAYNNFKDSKFNVSGEITIFNDGQLPAVITAVDDVLAGAPIDVYCGVTFPYTLAVGDTLTCTYDEDVASKIEGFNEVTVTTERDTYGDVVPIIWGDPKTEINKTVTIKDSSTLFGKKDLGTVTAPNGDTFTYEKTFKWADYGKDNCGSFLYKNTAKIVETQQTANATLKVNVQCLIFKGQTAWGGDTGFNIMEPGQWWYIFDTTGNARQTIWAGQTINVGNVTVSPAENGERTITMVLTGGWVLKADPEAVKIQGYDEIPGSAPAPGLFTTYKGTSLVVTVPDFPFYAIHLDVGQWVPDPTFGP